MKNRTPLYTVIALCLFSAGLIASCSLLGGCANTTPPSKTEQALFTTITNVVTVTNQVAIPVEVRKTNEVVLYSTNELNQTVVTYSNVVNVVWATNTVPVLATETNYVHTTRPEVKEAVSGIGSIINTIVPGVGSLVIEGVLGVLAGWATWRSRKKGQTANALAQEIETGRAFIRALPNGAAYDAVFVQFLKDHQAEAGVIQAVAGIIEKSVSNPDAKAAAQGVIDTINGLKSITSPLPPVNA